MKRNRPAYTPAERAAISELLALVGVLAQGEDPEKTKALGTIVIHRLKGILDGGKVYSYSDNQILRTMRALFDEEPPQTGRPS